MSISSIIRLAKYSKRVHRLRGSLMTPQDETSLKHVHARRGTSHARTRRARAECGYMISTALLSCSPLVRVAAPTTVAVLQVVLDDGQGMPRDVDAWRPQMALTHNRPQRKRGSAGLCPPTCFQPPTSFHTCSRSLDSCSSLFLPGPVVAFVHPLVPSHTVHAACFRVY